MRGSAADLAATASVSAAVWAAVRVGVGYPMVVAFLYGIWFFVAGVLFLRCLQWPEGAKGSK